MVYERSLSLNVRISLDAARAFAAAYVVIHHVSGASWFPLGHSPVFRFGQEAVILFFLLSGFVIFANEHDRGLSPVGYFLRRLRRIYPVLLFAMTVSTAIFFVDGKLYANFSILELLGTLLGLQDIPSLKPGVLVRPYLGNSPLWSLSYELFFYAVFPLVLKFWTKKPAATNNVIGAVCCISYISYALVPNHFNLILSYFMIWWTGAMVADAYLRGGRRITSVREPLCWLASLFIISIIVVALYGFNSLGVYPVLQARHFGVSVIVVIAIFGPFGVAVSRLLGRSAAFSPKLAAVSFGIYVLHVPILLQWNFVHGPVQAAIALVILLIASYIAEVGLMKLFRRPTRPDFTTPQPESR